MALTAQKQRFADRYLILNDGRVGAGAQAARDAGYSEKTARQIASRLLKDVDVIAYMRDRVSPVMSTAPIIVNGKMEADEVLTRLTGIARGDVRPFLDKVGLDFPDDAPTELIRRIKVRSRTVKDEDGNPVTETETELELHDPLSALNMLGKNMRLFDRAAEDDWRKQFEALGVNPDDFYEYAVQMAAARIEANNK
jgi:phage terminase small subunit